MSWQCMNKESIAADVRASLEEDIANGDVTASILPLGLIAEAKVINREPMVVCGQAWFDAVFKMIDVEIEIDWLVAEGSVMDQQTTLCKLRGAARSLLTGERTALNWLQTLSATASITKRHVEAIAGTGCQLLDTRKTIPGLRRAQKYAVTCGGGLNHRMGLFDGILIKENHILAAGSILRAVQSARVQSSLPVEVEVESITEFLQAVEAEPDRIMLDNFTMEELAEAVKLNSGDIALEASGNIGLHNIKQVAETGVDFISIGALTKNIQAIDLSMLIQLVLHDD